MRGASFADSAGFADETESLAGLRKVVRSEFIYLVVPTSGPLLIRGECRIFPRRGDQTFMFEPPQRRVDGATGKADRIHDLEAMAGSPFKSLKNQSSRNRVVHDYVEF